MRFIFYRSRGSISICHQPTLELVYLGKEEYKCSETIPVIEVSGIDYEMNKKHRRSNQHKF